MSSSDRLYPFFVPPSCGDKLLAAASSAKVELHRYPADALDGPEPATEISFELRGNLPVAGHAAAAVVRELLREFRTPRSPRQEGGAQ